MIGLLANFLGTEPRNTGDTDPGTGPPRDATQQVSGPAVVTDDELLDRLVEKFREGEVTDEQRRTLQQHLRPQQSTPVEVRLGHLQGKVADLEAYSDALETFIDAEGSGQEILDELRADIGTLDTELEVLASRLETLEDDQSALHTELTRLDDSVAALDSHVREVEGRHSREISGIDAKIDHVERTVEKSLDGIHDDIDDLHERFGGMRSTIDAVEADVRDLHGLETAVSELESQLEALESVPEEVSRLSGAVDDIDDLSDRLSTLESLPAEIATVKHELADLESFRAKFVDAVTVEARAPGQG